MKIIILVLSMDSDVYINLEGTIRETWGNNHICKIYYYYGGFDKLHLDGDIIKCTSNEGLYNIGHKTIESFQYLFDNEEFDFIFRTNSSSFINIDKMVDFLSNKPKEQFYCGYMNIIKEIGIRFASGSGYFLSKDVVRLILENKDKWNHEFIDDVSLGIFCRDVISIDLIQSKRCDINCISENSFYYKNLNVDKEITSDLLNNHFHFRCKTNSVGRKDDSLIMRKLYDYFIKNS